MPSMTEITGGQQPEVETPKDPTKATLNWLKEKGEAGNAKIAALTGSGAGALGAAAVSTWARGEKTAALYIGAGAIGLAISAAVDAVTTDRKNKNT